MTRSAGGGGGTPDYLDPYLFRTEGVIHEKINQQADIWSLGLTIFITHLGEFYGFGVTSDLIMVAKHKIYQEVCPRTDETSQNWVERLFKGSGRSDEKLQRLHDAEATSFIGKLRDLLFIMLQQKPEDRGSLLELANHPFFADESISVAASSVAPSAVVTPPPAPPAPLGTPTVPMLSRQSFDY